MPEYRLLPAPKLIGSATSDPALGRSATSACTDPLLHSFEYRVFKNALDKAGLDVSLTFHGLRHVAATLMVERGEHPRGIQA